MPKTTGAFTIMFVLLFGKKYREYEYAYKSKIMSRWSRKILAHKTNILYQVMKVQRGDSEIYSNDQGTWINDNGNLIHYVH